VKIKRSIIVLIAGASVICAKAPKKSWIQFRPHVYLGFGAVDVLSENPPEFVPRNNADINYASLNSLNSEGFAFQGQFRLSLIEAGLFSMGYSFWGHRYEYNNDYADVWYDSDTKKPLRYDLSLHSACLQFDSPWRFFHDHVKPYVLGGVGPYYGSSKVAAYFMDEATGWIWLEEDESQKYSGWALMAGLGSEIYRYAYVYTGIVYFKKEDVPGQLFLDLIVGIKL